jgi:hypothetical protein
LRAKIQKSFINHFIECFTFLWYEFRYSLYAGDASLTRRCNVATGATDDRLERALQELRALEGERDGDWKSIAPEGGVHNFLKSRVTDSEGEARRITDALRQKGDLRNLNTRPGTPRWQVRDPAEAPAGPDELASIDAAGVEAALEEYRQQLVQRDAELAEKDEELAHLRAHVQQLEEQVADPRVRVRQILLPERSE